MDCARLCRLCRPSRSGGAESISDSCIFPAVMSVLLIRNRGEQLLPFCAQQYKKGGPIIAVQVENEYGSYAKDPDYMTYVKKVMLAHPPVSVLNLSHKPPSL